ncbi:MAG TPA: MFS transporter [Acidimicrobiia bacterium]|jgi:MFS family permease|nr:MFS transporter [Acidimicrobiia bacterium]
MTPERVQRTYLVLLLLQTLAASLIWGINTLFLLDAGLSITEAFVANAAYTAGMVIFEVPTGVVADTFGRRVSYILGAATLLVTTAAYLGLWYAQAGIGWWILVSALIGLGFTFFSGATEAWLVDALEATGFEGVTETVFGKGQAVTGAATLIGTIGGGLLGQINLGLPYIARSVLLLAVIGAAWAWMHDLGYEPTKGVAIGTQVRGILRSSIEHGYNNPPIRMFMLAAPFASGVSIWIFYAFQPYLLELFGDPNATYLAGIAAAVFAVAQMIGGASIRLVRKVSTTRSGVLITQIVVGSLALIGVGLAEGLEIPVGFWVAIALLTLFSLFSSIAFPIQQAYMNGCIPSEQRATVLSFASLTGSAGGVVAQPALGRVADVFSFGIAYIVAGVIYVLSLPFLIAVKRMGLAADRVTGGEKTIVA